MKLSTESATKAEQKISSPVSHTHQNLEDTMCMINKSQEQLNDSKNSRRHVSLKPRNILTDISSQFLNKNNTSDTKLEQENSKIRIEERSSYPKITTESQRRESLSSTLSKEEIEIKERSLKLEDQVKKLTQTLKQTEISDRGSQR